MHQPVMERTRTQTPPPRQLPLGQQRNFTLLWTGQTISLMGSAVTTVGLPLAAITMLRASALQVGLLTAATYGAFILVALPAGVVVNRRIRRFGHRDPPLDMDCVRRIVGRWLPGVLFAAAADTGPVRSGNALIWRARRIRLARHSVSRAAFPRA